MSIASVRKRVSPEIHVRPALIAVHFRKFAFLHFTFSSLPYGATQHVRERLPQSEVNTLQVAKIYRLPHCHLPDAQRQEQVDMIAVPTMRPRPSYTKGVPWVENK